MTNIQQIVTHLRRSRYRVGQELWLQDDIAAALSSRQVNFEREARLAPGERIDFLVEGGIKTDQSRGINDPGVAAKPRTTDESRIKMLAEHVLSGGAV